MIFMTNEYQLNVSANKTGDSLVYGCMCVQWCVCTGTRKSTESGNGSLESWVWWFWLETVCPPSLLLFFLVHISSKHFWKCNAANKKHAKRMGLSWWFKDSQFWTMRKRFTTITVLSLLLFRPRHQRSANIMLGKPWLWILHVECATIGKQKQIGCGKVCDFPASFSLRWKHRTHTVEYLTTQIHIRIHPRTSVVCSLKVPGCLALTPLSWLTKLASISVGSVWCMKCTYIFAVSLGELNGSSNQ